MPDRVRLWRCGCRYRSKGVSEFVFNLLIAIVVLPVIAALMLFIGAAIVAPVVRRWERNYDRLGDTSAHGGGDRGWANRARRRYVLLGFAFWLAMSVFLVLDLAATASIFLRFTAAYAAFWILVGALLLHGSPIRHKLIILGLFLVAVFSIRFIDWNSRKPFLRDFYRIEEEMTPAQVDQIMADYADNAGNYGGPAGSHTDYEFNEQGEIVTGSVTYTHTNEGWGDSDWGVVTFEDGRVVQTRFLAD